MKKWSWLKIVGVVGAVVLITFGSMGNMLRTVKVAFARINSRD